MTARRPTDKEVIRKCLLPAVIFLALMGVFFEFFDPYRETGGNLLVGGDFDSAEIAKTFFGKSPGVSWEAGAGLDGSGAFRLDVKDGRRAGLRMKIEDAERHAFYRVTGWLRLEGVRKGKLTSDMARILFVFRDADGKPIWGWPHIICFVQGDRDWKRYSMVVATPPEARSVVYYAQNAGSGGTAWVDAASVTPVEIRPSMAVWWWGFLAIWIAGFVWTLWQVRVWSRPWCLAGVIVALAIIAGVVSPARTLRTVTLGAMEIVETAMQEKPASRATRTPAAKSANFPKSPEKVPTGHSTPQSEPTEKKTEQKTEKKAEKKAEKKKENWWSRLRRNDRAQILQKSGHTAMFAILAWLAVFSLYTTSKKANCMGLRFSTVIFGLVVFAAATEVLQYLSYARNPQVYDWLLDALGLVTGAVAGAATHRLTRFGRNSPPPSASSVSDAPS